MRKSVSGGNGVKGGDVRFKRLAKMFRSVADTLDPSPETKQPSTVRLHSNGERPYLEVPAELMGVPGPSAAVPVKDGYIGEWRDMPWQFVTQRRGIIGSGGNYL